MTTRKTCCGPSGQPESTRVPEDAERIVDTVRERYGRIARGQLSECCGTGTAAEASRAIGYSDDELRILPGDANLGLGCGAPVAALELSPGETVVDLGSGAGMDAFLAARQVGRTGKVIGVDMTPEMLEKARANAARAGLPQVEFRQGRLEALPVEAGSVDAVTSNCVINLVPDKAAVFREVARVLRPGGRIVVSDIVTEGELPRAIRQDVFAYVGCVAGAMERRSYFGAVEAAGLASVEVLKDVDFLEVGGYSISDELREALERGGIGMDDLKGKVRSITFRAIKPRS